MSQVFVRIHYSILFEPKLFKALADYIGHFKIEQTIQESWDQVCNLWFETDKVTIEEGKSRQVEINATQEEDNLKFEMKAVYP